ncbi:MAG: hypothetical protein NT011_10025 [Kiritimatiellaeota bacterium]|nr:hypothetical protein [Kiritimatiellota bacterium]
MKHAEMTRSLAAAIALGLVAGLTAQEPAAPAKDAGAMAPACAMMCGGAKGAAAKPQTLCPIMGGKCSKDIFVDVKRCCRIYVCCQDCVAKVKADPQAALAKIKANGEQPECVCVVCPKCGEYQGSDKCCQPGAMKCDKCTMDKDAPGCCKPDVLGKMVPCGMDASKCGMKATSADKPAVPAEVVVPAAAAAPAAVVAPVAAPAVPAEPTK